jgi:hypothetical protein
MDSLIESTGPVPVWVQLIALRVYLRRQNVSIVRVTLVDFAVQLVQGLLILIVLRMRTT